MEKLAYVTTSEKSFDEISSLVESRFPDKGFRVLAVHDVQETLAGKGFQINPLKIFEVCNAGFAYQAIKKDVNVAMFMPCKIVIRQEGEKTSITLVRPTMMAEMLPESDLNDLSAEVEKQLTGLINEIR